MCNVQEAVFSTYESINSNRTLCLYKVKICLIHMYMEMSSCRHTMHRCMYSAIFLAACESKSTVDRANNSPVGARMEQIYIYR